MADDHYPTLDPTTYDLIISGTGLPSSLLAAAASTSGKSVLHVDPNPFYGSSFSSLPPSSLPSSILLDSSGSLPEPSRSYSIDLAGPRLLFCADPLVDLLLRSGASHHVEFKSLDGTLIYNDGNLIPVPDSRQAIFRDKTLGLAEKREMMRFLKLVQGHIGNEEDGIRIEDDDLEIPFVEFLKKQKLPFKIRAIVLYAIALADYDQDEGEEGRRKVITTKEGIERIALYIKSVGRFPNAVGAFIYPMYGHGELAQAFCRCAAVKGALYVLRMPVVDILTNEGTKQHKGVKLASGQEIFSNHLIMESSSMTQSAISPVEREALNSSSLIDKVARGVCITSSSLREDLSNILMIFPPRTLSVEQLTTVRALQLSSNVSVCPQGMYVVYLSTPCDDANLGKEYIRTAISVLFSVSSQENSEGISTNSESEKATKPPLLWSAVYVQEITQASFETSYSSPPPDANLDYRNILESTMKLFSQMYPGEEFLPEATASGNAEEDDDVTSE